MCVCDMDSVKYELESTLMLAFDKLINSSHTYKKKSDACWSGEVQN